MIPDSIPKLSDLYTLSQRKLLENHALESGTNLYGPSGAHQMSSYMAVPPPPDINSKTTTKSMNSHQKKKENTSRV